MAGCPIRKCDHLRYLVRSVVVISGGEISGVNAGEIPLPRFGIAADLAMDLVGRRRGSWMDGDVSLGPVAVEGGVQIGVILIGIAGHEEEVVADDGSLFGRHEIEDPSSLKRWRVGEGEDRIIDVLAEGGDEEGGKVEAHARGIKEGETALALAEKLRTELAPVVLLVTSTDGGTGIRVLVIINGLAFGEADAITKGDSVECGADAGDEMIPDEGAGKEGLRTGDDSGIVATRAHFPDVLGRGIFGIAHGGMIVVRRSENYHLAGFPSEQELIGAGDEFQRCIPSPAESWWCDGGRHRGVAGWEGLWLDQIRRDAVVLPCEGFRPRATAAGGG